MGKSGMTFLTDEGLTAEQIRRARAADKKTRRAQPHAVIGGSTPQRGKKEGE